MTEIIIIADSDCELEFGAARHLAQRVGAHFVDRLSARLSDLLIVATYHAIEPVVVVILRDGKVVERLAQLTDERHLRALEASCH